MRLTLTGLLIFLCSNAPLVAAEAWTLAKNSDGIQVYTRNVDGSPYKAVRGVTRFETSLSSLVALLQDSGACPEWADRCNESYIEEFVNDQEMYVYLQNDLPWPARDRDVIAHVVWKQNPQTHVVSMRGTAVKDRLEKTRGIVRLTQAEMRWKFIPADNGTVKIVTESHIEPGGPVPAWISNMLIINAPFNTLKNLKAIITRPEYMNAHVGFVDEVN